MGIPTLQTSRLNLRPFSEDDVESLHQILGTRGVLQYFPNPEPLSRDATHRLIAAQLKHWDEHGCGWWGVEPRGRRELIGWCGLQYLPETDEVEVGFLLGRDFWGQGLATEGAKASLQFGFEQMGFEQIVAVVHPMNIASQRVIEKLGMSFVEETQYFGMQVFRYVSKAFT